MHYANYLIPLLGFCLSFAAAERYEETAEDVACYQKYNYHFDKTAQCFYREANKIEQRLRHKIKQLGKSNQYNDAWIQQQRSKIQNACHQEFYREKESITHLQTAFCVRLALSDLEASIH